MTRTFHQVKVPLDGELEQQINWLLPNHGPYRVLRQSVDARLRHSPHFVYSVEVAEEGENLPVKNIDVEKIQLTDCAEPPLIIGSGPAGLFAALRLVERGVRCRVFERGSVSTERIKGINRFWRYGELDPKNNVCYGEGGAGLYSDGKLITRIRSDHIGYVMNRLVRFGAPEEIQWLSDPHVGSDRIRRVIPRLREFLLTHGCEIHFDTKVTQLLNEGRQIVGVQTEHGQKHYSAHVILATGHSAEDMMDHLYELGVFIEGKSFAVGLRMEHPQNLINQIQYRQAKDHPKLKSANYRLAYHNSKAQFGVYSFCMCPGGYILSSGTEPNRVVTNGMSNFARNSPYANAAFVVTVDHQKMFGNDSFGGLKFRKALEQQAFEAVRDQGGTKELPAQRLSDFMAGRNGSVQKGSTPSGARPVRLDQILSSTLKARLLEGFVDFDRKMPGFINDDVQLFGVETRTSCPIRVSRDKDSLQSVSHRGLYPTGEGAGYAGGITSAACDGVRVADKIVETLKT